MDLSFFAVEVLANFVEGATCLLFAYALFGRGIRLKKLLPGLIAGNIAYTTAISLCNTVELVHSGGAFVFMAFMAAIVYFLMKPRFIYCITFSMIYIFFQTIIEMLSICIISIAANNPDYIFKILGVSWSRTVYVIVMRAIMLLLYFVIKNKLRTIKLKLLGEPVVLIAAVISYFIILRVVGFFNINNTEELKMCISFLFVAAAIGFGFIIYLSEKLIKDSVKKEEQNFLSIKNSILEENLKNLNALYEDNSKKFHEFNHHINTIGMLLEDRLYERAVKYVNEVSVADKYHNEFVTGNEIVDIVLNVKNTELKNNGIKLKIDITIPHETGIRDNDLCSLLLNLIENAAEAVEKESNKLIELAIKSNNQIICITVKNSSEENPIKKGFITNKKGNHGWGLKIINDIADRYNGSVKYDYDYSDKVFYVKVMLSGEKRQN